jgi:uncharacterized membrane protein
MNQALVRLSLVVCAGLFLACGGSDDPPAPLVDCTMVTVPKYSQLTAALPKCTACHSSALTGAARNMAPVGANFDTYEAAKAKATLAASRVSFGQMPPAGSTPLTADEKAAIVAWGSCGAPQ